MSPRVWFSLAMVAAGVALRVLPHPMNFAPIGAIALFAGAHFERRGVALIAPLAAMLAADAIIGFHSLMPVIYATYALIAVIGMLLRDRRTNVAAVGGGAVASATLFYLKTNFAVWLRSDLYAKTAEGLAACYVAALPFFGNTLASDVLYAGAFFGLFALGERFVPALAK